MSRRNVRRLQPLGEETGLTRALAAVVRCREQIVHAMLDARGAFVDSKGMRRPKQTKQHMDDHELSFGKIKRQ